MNKKTKKRLVRILVSLFIFLLALLFEHLIKVPSIIFTYLLYITAYVTAGYDVILKAVEVIKLKMLLDENFLMSLASLSAIIIGEKTEAVAVMVFYQIGELFSDIAVQKSRKSQKELMNLRPQYANLEVAGKLLKVSPEEVKIGDIIVINPGEKIALDGEIVSGATAIDVSAVLGESIPFEAVVGDRVTAGSTAQNGTIRVKVSAEYKDSTVAKIISLGTMASAKKTRAEKFTSRFARVYTPIVVALAVVIATIVPIILGDFSNWFHRALMFLVVSCPCALVVSVPLSFFSASGGASKCGILFKGSTSIEALSKIDTICFDKTGTLTDGSFTIREVVTNGIDKTNFLNLAAAIEQNSSHPIALSITNAGDSSGFAVSDHQNFAGRGVSSVVDGIKYYAGTARWFEELDIKTGTMQDAVYFAKENEYIGHIILGDNLKADAKTSIKSLRKLNIKHIEMLTGGAYRDAKLVAEALNLDYYGFKLMPQEKYEHLETLIKSGKTTAYIGDGINDVPCLSRANVGVSMGVLGSDAAIEAADVILMNDSIKSLVTAIKISKKAVLNAKLNIILSLAVKVIVMALCAVGVMGMWHAVFADVGVCVLAVANAVRLLNVRKYKK